MDHIELPPISPQPGKQDLMVNVEADFIIAGGSVGSSKSYSALMRSLRYIDCPYYRAGYFRRNSTDLRGPGGLFEEAQDMFERFGVHVRDKEMSITFPSGAKIFFHHLDDEKKVNKMYSGLQYTAMFIDEVQYWSEYSVLFLQSRLRSKSKYPSFMFLTCNPEPPPHWLHKWVDYYLLKKEDIEDECDHYKAGRANQNKTADILHYVIEDGNPIFSNDVNLLLENYPHLCKVENLTTGKIETVKPKTFTFIGATMFDNGILLRTRPEYLREMNAKEEVEKERLLYGNWYVQPKGANYFDRSWLTEVEKLPTNITAQCRAWDKAYSEVSEKNRYVDYTAGSPLFSKDRDGTIYISWGFHEDVKDAPTDVVTGHFRKDPGDRDELILKQAKHDGTDVTVILSRDAAGAGKQEFENASKALMLEGFTVEEDPLPVQTSKLAKFSPFSSAAKNGHIKIVKSSFPNQQTYEAYMKHLEGFTGERSKGHYHDDWADATSSAFNHIVRAKNYCRFILPDTMSTTRYTNVMSNIAPQFGESLMNKGGHIV